MSQHPQTARFNTTAESHRINEKSAVDCSHFADADPLAPWNIDRTYGGMSPAAARASWEAKNRRPDCKIACNIDPLRGLFASNSDPL